MEQREIPIFLSSRSIGKHLYWSFQKPKS